MPNPAELTAPSKYIFHPGGAKAESPPMFILFNFNGAIDPLPARPKASAGDLVVVQENFPYHAVGVGWSDLSVIPNDGDGLEGVEGQIFVVLHDPY
ncbi:hypothetical protein CRG98_038295 [Punica granatum]|uniref:Uncharacterized protein n=1 Tax=Punica granatum TaxID=22663 RepID=A0A2I0IBD6_PUNGR|nr:hypothetical protein CRG98_038295 [Punica granatum]